MRCSSALGGSSYAAIRITGKNVKNGTLTGADVKNRSLTGSDVKDKSLGPADFNGSVQGPKGDTGPQGAKGDLALIKTTTRAPNARRCGGRDCVDGPRCPPGCTSG